MRRCLNKNKQKKEFRLTGQLLTGALKGNGRRRIRFVAGLERRETFLPLGNDFCLFVCLGRLDAADELGMAVALNHSAARHKISIRPKRNHAPARPRHLPQVFTHFFTSQVLLLYGLHFDSWRKTDVLKRELHRQSQHFTHRRLSVKTGQRDG